MLEQKTDYDLGINTEERNLEHMLQNMLQIYQSILSGKRQYLKKMEIRAFEAALYSYLLLEPTHWIVQKHPNRDAVVQAYLAVENYYRNVIGKERVN